MARPSLFSHRKFTRLSRMLGAPYKAAGVLEVIWHHAYQDGDPRVGTSEDVEFMVGWDGEPGACVAALVDAGFLDRDEAGELSVHDLEHHAPEYVKARARKERQRSRQRDEAGTEPNPSRDATVTVTGRDRDCHPTPAPAPAPAPLDDESSTSDETVGPEPEADSGPSAVLSFPVTGKNGGTWPLSQAYLGELQTAFPALDILAEARKARAWIVGNPSRRKTPRGMTRFLYGWMERCQNRGAATVSGRPPDRDYSAELAAILREQSGSGHAA